ncbi:midcut-by-XrtH protein [Mangrovimicrobium sediminis]|uniref:Midcut-by-XrtH protein n=1 Tax=Mangrovimicrobium sediminis TaxID=2562682 RepID=A0A4Z0LZ47_9GAMM|nr:midcut-by-XrtH protein [Haliea sp. SAOS-164]TGD72642.1 midcut-by-XrtH protein [Haliea sp. SAOS-164]
MNRSSIQPLAIVALTLSLVANPAAAQIIYSPTSVDAVPTLSGYALLLLALLMVVVAWRRFARHGAGGAALVLVVAAGASGIGGAQLVSDAVAGGGGGNILSFIDSPTGGSVPITDGSLNIFENTSGVPQDIDDVIPPESCPNIDFGPLDGAPQCVPGATVSTGANGMCYVDCRIPVL